MQTKLVVGAGVDPATSHAVELARDHPFGHGSYGGTFQYPLPGRPTIAASLHRLVANDAYRGHPSGSQVLDGQVHVVENLAEKALPDCPACVERDRCLPTVRVSHNQVTTALADFLEAPLT